MKISQNRNYVFLLRLTFSITNFEQVIYNKKKFSCIFFKGIFFVEMQAEQRAFGPKNSQKSTLKDNGRINIKIYNRKS